MDTRIVIFFAIALIAFVLSLYSIIAIILISKDPYCFYKDRIKKIEKEKELLENKAWKIKHDLSMHKSDLSDSHNL